MTNKKILGSLLLEVNFIGELSMSKKRRILRDTSTQHWLNWVLWPILRIILEPFSKKQSHGWHWVELPKELIPEEEYYIHFKGDPAAKKDTGRWSSFWLKNFGWQTVAFISPQERTKPYRIGFRTTFMGELDEIKICTIICLRSVSTLIGQNHVDLFALSYPDNKPLKFSDCLALDQTTTKKKDLCTALPLL